ncbi:MAG TPA: methyltransferase domain-containing protein [Pseudolabrys sp.]|nr:methyltransferase domain-containing protein [Pseudolabrys sp.]
MADTDKVFAGSIPENYERYLVPLIFAPYAADLGRRLQETGPERVLETAAGTGVVTRAIAARLPASARITATDLNEPMLNHARTRLADPRVAWRTADAQALPFDDQSFDAVVCQFGAMFFPDKVKAYREARRVLKPGGRFLFNVWDKIADNEFADVVTQTVGAMFPDDPPLFLARTPHGHHDVARIRADLTAAGFAEIAAEGRDERSKAASPREPAVAYCEGTPLRNEIEARDKARLQEATARSTEAIARRFGTGPVDGRIRAIIVTAVK